MNAARLDLGEVRKQLGEQRVRTTCETFDLAMEHFIGERGERRYRHAPTLHPRKSSPLLALCSVCRGFFRVQAILGARMQ